MAIRTYKKGQPIQYQYKKLGLFPMRFTNTISALGIQATDSFRQLQAIENLDEKFYRVLENGFKNCTQLSSVTFNQSLTTLDPSAFENCIALKQLTLPSSLKTIGASCFKGCNNLQMVSFDWFDEEIPDGSTATASQLASLGAEAFGSCSRLNGIVVPASVTSTSQIASTAFKDSNISQVTFLGIPSSANETIKSTEVFGNSKNCTFFTSDAKKFVYSAQAKSITQDTAYNLYGSVKSATLGHTRLGRFHKFDRSVVDWCINASSKDGARFPQVPCPVIVAYGDFKTSAVSKQFLANVIEDKQFQKSLQTSLNCYLFVLSRNGQIERSNSVDQDLLYFRNTLNSGKEIERQFVSLNFYYGVNFSTTTTMSSSPSEILSLLRTGAERTGFNHFDYEKFDVKLEDPYVEQAPSGSGSAQSGYDPWWWNNGSIQTLPNWNPS